MKTPITRRLFFWTLFVSYFCITTLVLFFVFGYRHDFAQKIFVHTGSLTIKTNPKEISIRIDGETPNSRLVNIINGSYFINGLKPKKHDLSITRDGFHKWQKKINIHSGLSTEFWNILLIKNNYSRDTFAIEDIDNFFPAPKENLFATTRQMGKTLMVSIFDTEQNVSINLFIFSKTHFTQNKNENIEWSPTSKDLIIPIIHTSDYTNDYAIGQTSTNDSFLISDIIKKQNIKSVRWDPMKKNTIYFLSEGALFRAVLPTDDKGTPLTQIFDNVLAYDFADDGLYLLSYDGTILYSPNKQDFLRPKILTKFDIDINHKNYRLIAYDNHRVISIDDDNNDLHIYNKGDNNTYTKKITQTITGAHFSDDGKKLLFYSPFEIFIYFTRDSIAQPPRSEDQTQSIVRFSKALANIHFAKDYEHVIFTTNDSIKITELDYRGSNITNTITNLNESTIKIINKHKMNKLLFIDSTDTKNRQLQAIDFPEKETLF